MEPNIKLKNRIELSRIAFVNGEAPLSNWDERESTRKWSICVFLGDEPKFWPLLIIIIELIRAPILNL